MSDTAIETYTGLMFDFADPQPEQVCVEDVAHALSLTCRFGGHVEHLYSVAQHALMVYRLVAERRYSGGFNAGRRALHYAALHHDSAEAYTGDVPTPLKRALGAAFRDTFADLNARAEAAVGAHFGIDPALFEHRAIKAADEWALRLEASTLKVEDGRTFAEAIGMPPVRPAPMLVRHRDPVEVEHEFLRVHQTEMERLTANTEVYA